MRFLVYVPFCMIATVAGVSAQVTPQFNFSFTAGEPRGAFAEHLRSDGYGFNVFGGIAVDGTPLAVGLLGSLYVYGNERRLEPLSANIPDIVLEVETENYIVSGHLVARLQPDLGRVRLFADGLLGFNHLFTETSLEQEGHFGLDLDDDRIVSSTNIRDTALSYGVGGGVSVRVYRNQIAAIRIVLATRYLVGGNAKYLLPGAIDRAGGVATLHTDRSKTNLLTTSLGIGFTFLQ